jgi:NADH-quinone oxidoreductase subunit N
MIDQEFLKLFVTQLQISVSLFKPEMTLLATFVVALIFDVIFKKYRSVAGIVVLVGFAVTAVFLGMQNSSGDPAFSHILSIDPFGQFFKFIILLASFLIVLMSFFSKELYSGDHTLGEYYSLIAGMTFGMFLITSASNMIMIYLSLELMSISSYVLAGYTKEIKRSSEASLKYVIFGAVSSGLMIYGISIMYGLTGSLSLAGINHFLAANQVNQFALIISSLMIIAGFGYKISAVPFHFWTPDVYEGAPVTITALLSVASKAAGFAVLIRFVKIGFAGGLLPDTTVWSTIGGMDWTFFLAVLSVITMTIGNLIAVWQTNVKRLLAYSSIAHAGYLLMGVTVMSDTGVAAILIYFVMYLFMNIGAFYFVMLVANKIGSEEIDDYVGLGYRAPLISVCMVIFLISLTGLPPTAGFIGKWYLFTAVLQNSRFVWLAVIGVLNSVVSLFYYAKIFRNMYLRDVDSQKEKLTFSPASIALMVVIAIPNLLFCFYFSPIVNWAQYSVKMIIGN